MENNNVIAFAYDFCDKISEASENKYDEIESIFVKDDNSFEGSISLYNNTIVFQKCQFLKHTSTTTINGKDDFEIQVSSKKKKTIMVSGDDIFHPIIGSSCYVVNWVTFDRLLREDYYFNLRESYTVNRIYSKPIIKNDESGSCLMYYNGAIQNITENRKENMYFLKDNQLYLVNNCFNVQTEYYVKKEIKKKRQIEIISQLLRIHFVRQGCYKIIPRVANNICVKWLPNKTTIETILRRIAKEDSKMYIWRLYEEDIQNSEPYSLSEIQSLQK